MPLLAIVGNPGWTAETVRSTAKSGYGVGGAHTPGGRFEIKRARKKGRFSVRSGRKKVFEGSADAVASWLNKTLAALQQLRDQRGLNLPLWEFAEHVERLGGLPNSHVPQTHVLNAYTGEVRSMPFNPAEATLAACVQDLGPAALSTPIALVNGGSHVRSGPWCAVTNSNPRKARKGTSPKMWARLLDTIHYTLRNLWEQQGGMGVASITKKQWTSRFAKGKSTGAKDKAWHDFTKWIQKQDRTNDYGIEALVQRGWLHLNINNAYDAAWIAQPGTLHQLGMERERELLHQLYGAPGQEFELAGKLADLEDFYAELYGEPETEAEWAIPGGSLEAYQELLRQARLGVEARAPVGRLERERQRASNPQERVAARIPKEYDADLWEFEDHPGFWESWEKFGSFHEADPRAMVIFEIDDGSDEETWLPVHAALHETVETNYRVPKSWTHSNKHQGAEGYRGSSSGDPGLWTHKHYQGKRGGRNVRYPLELAEPFVNVTRKVLRGSDLAHGWWNS